MLRAYGFDQLILLVFHSAGKHFPRFTLHRYYNDVRTINGFWSMFVYVRVCLFVDVQVWIYVNETALKEGVEGG